MVPQYFNSFDQNFRTFHILEIVLYIPNCLILIIVKSFNELSYFSLKYMKLNSANFCRALIF